MFAWSMRLSPSHGGGRERWHSPEVPHELSHLLQVTHAARSAGVEWDNLGEEQGRVPAGAAHQAPGRQTPAPAVQFVPFYSPSSNILCF